MSEQEAGRSRGGSGGKGLKGSRDEFELSIFNPEKMMVQRIDRKKLEEGLQEVAAAANVVATRLAAIQDYHLQTFDISVGGSATSLFVTINGGISLHFEKPKASQKPTS